MYDFCAIFLGQTQWQCFSISANINILIPSKFRAYAYFTQHANKSQNIRSVTKSLYIVYVGVDDNRPNEEEFNLHN